LIFSSGLTIRVIRDDHATHNETMSSSINLLFFAVLLVLSTVGRVVGVEIESSKSIGRHTPLPGAGLFAQTSVERIRIELTQKNLEQLRRQPRRFVRATVTAGKTVYPDVAVHLKGATGSFRTVDDKPSFTLDFSRFNGSSRFHGLRRIHLNNSVEDPSYLNELLGSELFNLAGVPAPRVTHAMVELNGRSLGLYVLKEGFTQDFLAGHFQNTGGNLYEPIQGHDVDQEMKCVLGQVSNNGQTDLRDLAKAAQETDPTQRWLRFEKTLEIERFLTFAALEVMIVHRDGYCLARNNFRVYHDLDTREMVFLPQGMDQLWGIPDLSWRPHMAGLVASAILDTAEGKERYRERFAMLFGSVFRPEALISRKNQFLERIRPVLNAGEFESIRQASERVAERIIQRQRDLSRQLSQPELKPLEFRDDIGYLEHWTANGADGGKLDRIPSSDGQAALHISAEADTSASWRTKVQIRRGHYRFEGQARITGVKPLPYGVHQGAGLRVAGQVRQSDNFTGDSSWRDLRAEFEVAGEVQELEFICELRARAGEAWFRTDSLRVVQIH
jgi:spore coat protein H